MFPFPLPAGYGAREKRSCLTSVLSRHPALLLPAEPLMTFDLLKAFVLGVVEGLTTVPAVCSTGHLLLVQQFFGFESVMISADLCGTNPVRRHPGAIVDIFFPYLATRARRVQGSGAPIRDRDTAYVLPAAVVGALAHDFIKSVLFNVWIVCFTLIVGGAILLWATNGSRYPLRRMPRAFHCRCILSSAWRSACP